MRQFGPAILSAATIAIVLNTTPATSKSMPRIGPAYLGPVATEANYSYTTFDVPGAAATRPMAINDKDDIVGSFYREGQNYAFAYIDGKLSEILSPIESCGIDLRSIDDSGCALGDLYGSDFIQPFLYDSRAILPLKISIQGTSVSLDNLDQVAGHTSLSRRDLLDFVSRRGGTIGDGRIRKLNGIVESYSCAGTWCAPVLPLSSFVVNRSGDVAGNDYWQNGFTTVGGITGPPAPKLGGISTANDFNDSRTVVGMIILASRPNGEGGYIASAGELFWLDPPQSQSFPLPWVDPNAPWTDCNGINNSNVVVGDYRGADGSIHGFVATPN